MESSACKLYHVDGFDSRQFLETYMSDKPEVVFAEETLIFPIENLTKTFAAGLIRGEILVDLSVGPMIQHLYAACEFFKHIIVLKTTDRCILELKRWLDTRTGAFHWGHATQLHVDTEGKSKDHDDFRRCLGKFSRLLKPGGHIILIGTLNATYFTVGKDKIHVLRYDEDLARKALVGEGFVIDCCKVMESKVVSDLCDTKGTIFIVAHKEK
ncbi:hypothetical protein GDO78_015632 [Eleutherodactylus coqui]|uniref:Uncharacterized protein n=1 Tax=Eleutherodactylus coqui TaxID=57060 RepID=A0A8J6EBX9_ELECQ|nr:hypothetical protein GDO78_015632 [Eleutherodactylus coqui]